MESMFQRIKDWYATTIGRYLRTFKFADKADRETGYHRSGSDPCNVNSEELEAMRRIFDRAAKKYSLDNIAV